MDQGDSKAEQVRRCGGRCADQKFGGQEPLGARDFQRTTGVCQIQVDQVRSAFDQDHILRFDISMQQTAIVQGCEGFEQVGCDLQEGRAIECSC